MELSTPSSQVVGDHNEAASSVQHERPSPDSASGKKRQKLYKNSDVKSFKLKPAQHELLLLLESTFPDWPTRRSTEPAELRHGVKWKAIEAEMKANFPELALSQSSMISICAYGKKCRELKALRRWKEDYGVDKMAGKAKLGATVGTAKLQQELAGFFATTTELARQHEQDKIERASLVCKVEVLEEKVDALSADRQATLLLRGEYETQVLSLQRRVCFLESQAQQTEEYVADLENDHQNGKDRMKLLLDQLKGAMVENFKLVEAATKPLK